MENIYTPQSAEVVSYGTPIYEPREETQEDDVNDVVVEEQQQEVVVTEVEKPEVVSEETVEVPELSEQERIFKEMFQKTFGVEPDEFKAQLEESRAEKQRLEAERQLSQLQSEWGVDEVTLSNRLELINQRLSKLPDATRQALDNYEGINLIWNALRAESSQINDPTPRYERNSVASVNTQRPMFTKQQLAQMTPAEYRANNDAILYAYQNNLIA